MFVLQARPVWIGIAPDRPDQRGGVVLSIFGGDVERNLLAGGDGIAAGVAQDLQYGALAGRACVGRWWSQSRYGLSSFRRRPPIRRLRGRCTRGFRAAKPYRRGQAALWPASIPETGRAQQEWSASPRGKSAACSGRASGSGYAGRPGFTELLDARPVRGGLIL